MTAAVLTVRDGRRAPSVTAAARLLAAALYRAAGWAVLEPRARVVKLVCVLLVRGLIAPVVIAGLMFLPRALVNAYCLLILGVELLLQGGAL